MATTQGIKLDDATKRRLKDLGEKRHRSPHWLMKTAIEDYLNREERYEREREEDEARWEQYQLTGQAVSHEAVSVWLADLAAGKVSKCPRP